MNFVHAQYVLVEEPPPSRTLIRALADDGSIWWLDDNCTQGDWKRFIEQGGEVTAASAPEQPPA